MKTPTYIRFIDWMIIRTHLAWLGYGVQLCPVVLWINSSILGGCWWWLPHCITAEQLYESQLHEDFWLRRASIWLPHILYKTPSLRHRLFCYAAALELYGQIYWAAIILKGGGGDASIVTVFTVFNPNSRRSETFCQSEKLDILWNGSWCLISHTNGSFSFNIRWRKPLALQPVEMPHSFCWLMMWLRTLCQAAHWEAWQPPQG